MDKLKLATFLKQDKVVYVYKSIFVFLLMMGVSNFSIGGVYKTFASSLVFSMLPLGFNPYFLSISFFVCNLCANLTGNGLVFGFLVVVGIIIYDTLKPHKMFKSNMILLYVIFAVINVGYFIIFFDSITSFFNLSISIIFNILFFYIANNFFYAITKRRSIYDINLDEKICGAIVLVVFMVGVCNYSIDLFDFDISISLLVILISTYVFSGSFCIMIGVLLGIAFSIAYINPVFISLFVVLSLVSIAFRSNYKIFSVVGVVIAHLLFSMYFIDYYAFSIVQFICIVIVGILFQFTPIIVFETITSVLCKKDTSVILIDVLNRTKSSISNKLKDISHVFSKMDKVFRKMVRGKLQDSVAISMVKDDVYNHMCANCPKSKECVYIPNEICDDVLSDIIKTAFLKGKISVLDIPQRVSSICNVTELTNVVNKVMLDFKSYYDLSKNMDSSRLLIASQLNGVSKLLDKLSIDVNTNISFDVAREQYIKAELSYKNIIVYECIVYEKDINTLVVNLIINSTGCSKKTLEKIVSNCCNSKLHIVSIDHTENKNAVLVTLSTKPNYDIVYGASSVNKNGDFVSGDNYTLIKIDDSRYMVALCDGMGSGKVANNISTLTLSLIENYYKAGFDDDVIISSINKLLMLSEEENYSTVDLCVLDLKKNNYSFIKLGASVSFIKSASSTIEIEGSGLPIGILEDIKPHIILKKINEFDTVILCSDGVVDSFSKTSLKDYINSLDIINPNTLAKTILDKAVSNYAGLYKDDMTVVAIRVFPT